VEEGLGKGEGGGWHPGGSIDRKDVVWCREEKRRREKASGRGGRKQPPEGAFSTGTRKKREGERVTRNEKQNSARSLKGGKRKETRQPSRINGLLSVRRGRREGRAVLGPWEGKGTLTPRREKKEGEGGHHEKIGRATEGRWRRYTLLGKREGGGEGGSLNFLQ